MIRTILVPLDGSDLAETALPHACLLAAEVETMDSLLNAYRGSGSPSGVWATSE